MPLSIGELPLPSDHSVSSRLSALIRQLLTIATADTLTEDCALVLCKTDHGLAPGVAARAVPVDIVGDNCGITMVTIAMGRLDERLA